MQFPRESRVEPQCKTSTRQDYNECHVQRGRGQMGRPCENAKCNAEGATVAVPKGVPSGVPVQSAATGRIAQHAMCNAEGVK